MDFTRLRTCLDDEFRLLRAAVAAADPTTRVPSCPDWTAGDLATHVAQTYLHKVECIRLGAFPEPWPPESIGPDPLTALDDAYAALTAEFDAHQPADPSATWHEPDQTVGFWIRRMAQETVIHRVDAELAAGTGVSPIPDDLAVDGIDELLTLFLAYAAESWPEDFGELLSAPDERPLALLAGEQAWTVRAAKDNIVIAPTTVAAASETASASVAGTAPELLLWLWNRADDASVTRSGDPELLRRFHEMRVVGTQ